VGRKQTSTRPGRWADEESFSPSAKGVAQAAKVKIVCEFGSGDRNRVRELRKEGYKWSKEGYSQVDIGIGINLGIAAIGNFGSAKRFDYTVIGDR
jgi:class 3 adenylate cyclase